MGFYHEAARDGYLEPLHGATKKDANKPDEDGLTPTLCASFHGNVDALRVLIGRGGDPDKADLVGNTCLHLAALAGHIHCVTFLLSYGVNLWALDNDHHTAFDLAFLNSHKDIVKYLDAVMAKNMAKHPKLVRKLKAKAILAANKRIKVAEKAREKAQRKMEKYRKKQQNDKRLMAQNGGFLTPRGDNKQSSIRSDSVLVYRMKNGAKNSTSSVPVHYSDFTHPAKLRTGISRRIHAKKSQDGGGSTIQNGDFKIKQREEGSKGTIRSMRGYLKDNNILYVPSIDLTKSTSEPDLTTSHDSGYEESDVGTMFERPGFGSVAFLKKPEALYSLPEDKRSVAADSIGTVGSLAGRLADLPWDHDDVLPEDGAQYDELEAFLMLHGLINLFPLLRNEKIDMHALLLLTDQDLEKELRLQLGPRKKLGEAIKRHKAQKRHTCQQEEEDTYL